MLNQHHTDMRPVLSQRRGRWFVALAVVVDIPLLIAFSLTTIPSWAGTIATAFTLICAALYVLAERESL
ncbi:MAG: hypothetical protein ABR992_19605 [Solirubrobacteraceae bacterium]|jgi:hypothetical protein